MTFEPLKKSRFKHPLVSPVKFEYKMNNKNNTLNDELIKSYFEHNAKI